MDVVTVKPHGDLSILKNSLEIRLNQEDNLSKIRKELRNFNIETNDSISFVSRNKNEISYEIEKEIFLKDIIVENDSFYLMQSEILNWRYFNETLKLDYGRILKFDKIEKANKRAFTMDKCKLTESNKRYDRQKFEFASS